jgi:3'-phosphoadenosine 5'-phosphosulfate sulfotransferase (PAPS reductase)/FAD synthetase
MNPVDFYLEDLKSKFSKINNEEYYLSYSGGRDSHFLYWFIKEYLKDTQIKIVSVNTYMEHDQIQKRMNMNADTILRPVLKPFEIKEKYGLPCFSKIQDEMISRYQRGSRSPSLMQFINGSKNNGKTYFKLNNTARTLLLTDQLHKISNKCCYYMKKLPFKNYEKTTKLKAIVGVRSSEGINRKARYTSCFTGESFTPIYDLTDDLLKEIEKRYNIEVPPIYNYIDRTGCMGCPYGSHHGDTEKELALINDNQRKFVMKLFKESYEVLKIQPHRRMTIFDLLEKETED